MDANADQEVTPSLGLFVRPSNCPYFKCLCVGFMAVCQFCLTIVDEFFPYNLIVLIENWFKSVWGFKFECLEQTKLIFYFSLLPNYFMKFMLFYKFKIMKIRILTEKRMCLIYSCNRMGKFCYFCKGFN